MSSVYTALSCRSDDSSEWPKVAPTRTGTMSKWRSSSISRVYSSASAAGTTVTVSMSSPTVTRRTRASHGTERFATVVSTSAAAGIVTKSVKLLRRAIDVELNGRGTTRRATRHGSQYGVYGALHTVLPLTPSFV